VASGEATLPGLRAADGEPTGYRFYPASREEAAAAALAAEQAFPVYSQTSPEVRARFLDTLADELDLLGEDFFAIAHQETALPLARLQGERAGPAISYACSPACCVAGMPSACVLIPRCLRASRCRARICASI
jgi:acyl-CoA reductase-like NAD-dependent aldehyde dehydrogenase